MVLLWWCGVAGDGMMVWWRDGVMVLLWRCDDVVGRWRNVVVLWCCDA